MKLSEVCPPTERSQAIQNYRRGWDRAFNPKPPSSVIPVESPYRKYFILLRQRLDDGAIQYGDRSFDMSNEDLIASIQEEILDIAGWGYVLWKKLEDLKIRIPNL